MNFAALLGRNSGRATPSLRRTPKAHQPDQETPAGIHLSPARSCSDNRSQLLVLYSTLSYSLSLVSQTSLIGSIQLPGDILCPEMGVPKEHPWVFVSADKGYLGYR